MIDRSALTERLREALYLVVLDAVREEQEACIALLDERVRAAEQALRDHMSDPIEDRRELAAYERGLRDAAFALRERRDDQ